MARLLLTLFLLVSGLPVLAQINLAQVHLYVFGADGLPQRGVSTSVGGVTYASDADGVLSFRDQPGTHEYLLKWQARTVIVTLTLKAGSGAEAMVTLSDTATTESATGPSRTQDAPAPGPAASLGHLSGTILHFETHKPVAGATLLFRGLAVEAKTDAAGHYEVDVPEGSVTLSVIHPEFATQTKEVDVSSSQPAVLDWDLTPSAFQMEAVQVMASDEIQVLGGLASLTDETKNSGVVLNLLGSEQISKSGDSDAAGALGRVTGLTVVGGKYVYVRGMGERYSSTYMNGGRLPSPELDRRVVPLDLFPTAVIESLAVQKTYDPALYGDFSGGAVTIRTLGVPQDRYQRRLRGSVAVSLGFDLDSVFRTEAFQQTGPADWLGFALGSRDRPAGIDPAVPVNEESLGRAGYTPAQMTALGRGFRNTWGTVDKLVLPDLSTTFSLRDKYDLSRTDHLGWSASVLYKHSMATDAERSLEYGDTEGKNIAMNTVTETHSQEVNWGGLLNVEYQSDRVFSLRSTTLFTRITNDDFKLTTGKQKEVEDERIYEEAWVEQSLFNQMVSTNWQWEGWLPWRWNAQYSLSLAGRSEPDHRMIGYGMDSNGVFDAKNQAGNPYRLFLAADDTIHDGTLSVTMPVPFLGEASDQVIVGGQIIHQRRLVTNNRYTWDYGQSPHTTDPLDTIFDPSHTDNEDPNAMKFFENTKASDNYVGTHSVLAGYTNFDLVWGPVRTNLGARVESSTQILDTFKLGTLDPVPLVVVLSTVDVLPSANFTLPLGREFQLRAGVSRTVNRPDFIEISNTVKEGLPGQGLYRGNPLLGRAQIWNGDLRLEQYLTPTESWSIGGFYKDFTNPIEVAEATGSTGERSPVNVPKATNWGAELEWTLSGAGLADALRDWSLGQKTATVADFVAFRQTVGLWSRLLRDLNTSGNLSWIHSEIDYGTQDKGNNTSARRPLQGQSPWVINVSLGYRNSVSWSDSVRSDTSVTLNYNVFGPRLKTIGTGGLPDSYEQPFHQLDLVLKHRFDDSWSLDTKVKNLLDLPLRETMNGLVLSDQRKGRTLSVGAKYEF